MDLTWLAEMLERPGYSQAGLARAMGKDAAAVNRMLKGERQIKANELPIITGYLKTAPPGNAEDGYAQPIRPLHGGDRADVPVWSSSDSGSDGSILLASEPIEFIRRSERMLGVKNPFAFYVIGGSMSPAFDHGDQVVVNPAVPVRPGADCVFVRDEGSGTMRAQVKRLLKTASDHWRVRQYSPARDFDLPKKKWPRALMIAEKRYA